MKKTILILVSFMLLLCTACGKENTPVEQVAEEQILNETDYTREFLSTEEKAFETASQVSGDEVLSKEDLTDNIALAYMIYSSRDQEHNKSTPIIVSDYKQENRDKLWEAYMIPAELENYALSINTESSNEYIVGIIKPKPSYNIKVADSIKLLRSGYIGELSDAHSLDKGAEYVEEVGDYMIVCFSPDAATLGPVLAEKVALKFGA